MRPQGLPPRVEASARSGPDMEKNGPEILPNLEKIKKGLEKLVPIR